MAESIKLFEHLGIYFETLAILPSGSNQTRCIFWKQVSFAGSMILYSVASLAYFLFDANNVMEYGDSYNTFTTEVLGTVYYFSFILKINNIMAYIDDFNILFHESESIN